MGAAKKSQCCCCAPYPTFDLTYAIRNGEGCEGNVLEGLKNDVLNACAQYGCFHVTIDQSSLGEEFGHMGLLSDVNKVRMSIESMFEEDFTSAYGDNTSSAKYRGRASESGSSCGLEPKQSWEMFRCSKMLKVASSCPPTGLERLSILKDYMKIFHEVSLCLFSNILGLPRQTFVEERNCDCDDQKENSYCTMDLLRVFRYDALSAKREVNLGSSPHTDWGSLTVVWQDNKGGLEIYCHEHEMWNKVEIESEPDESVVRLFIHIGDFTSLAQVNNLKEVSWPSPLHRVVCPRKSCNSMQTSADDARCSLVYFVYPPRGVSLNEAQASLSAERTPVAAETSDDMTGLQFPFHRYMVLKDQSLGDSSACSSKEAEMYQRILKTPFDSVIEKKWMQVQRPKD